MKRRRAAVVVAAVILIAVFVVFFTDLVNVDLASFLPKLRLQQSETSASSTITLQAVRNLYAFNTVEYVHRAVFPYDYLPDDVSLNTILAKLRTAQSSVKDALTPEEYLYFQAYNLAVDVGMDLGARRDFVVVTVVVTAGFDLTGLNDGTPPVFRAEEVDVPEGTIRRAVVNVPPPAITDIRVEDIVKENYPYPDVPIGADGWRRVVAFVERQAEEIPEMAELLEIAGENGRNFVRELLLRAGYDEVVFE